MQDLSGLLVPSGGRLLSHQVGLNHLLISSREQGRDLTQVPLDCGGFLLGCEHEQDRTLTVEDLEERLWFCSFPCSHQSVGGAITGTQHSLVVALIDGNGTVSIGDAHLSEGLSEPMRGRRQR